MIRGPRKSDQAYIASTWVRSMSGVAHRPLGKAGGAFGALVDQVLDRTDTRALVRHAAGDMDAILGWVVYVDGPGVPVVHFVYVRKDHREKGYARELLHIVGCRRETSLVYTCRGPNLRELLTAYPAATHVPLAEFLKPAQEAVAP